MIDLTGERFGRLTVLKRDGSDKSKNVTWLCKCDCGNEVVKSGANLRNGDTKSCGCLQKEVASRTMSTHGESKTRLYKIWAGMKTRCYNPKSNNYKYYGAKGVGMCDVWKDSFEEFKNWAINNGNNEDADAHSCSIDRIDNSKPYAPENCRWVSHIDQCNNQTSNKILSYNNMSMTMAEWAKYIGIKYTTLRARIRRGAPLERALKK